MKVFKFFLSVAICSLIISGCDDASNSSGGRLSHEEIENSKTDRFNDYIQVSNALSGGLDYMRDKYIKENIPEAKASQDIDYPNPFIFRAVDEHLSKMKDIKDISVDLNEAGKDLKIKMKAIEKDYNDFNIYYRSGEYKTDNLAKGKEADSMIKSNLDHAVLSFDNFQRLLKITYEKRKKEELEYLKKSGDQLAYHQAAALYFAEKLVNVYSSQKDLQDDKKNIEADNLSLELQKQISLLNADYNKSNTNGYNGITSNLANCLKYYRKFRDTGDVDYFNFMVSGYNQAANWFTMNR